MPIDLKAYRETGYDLIPLHRWDHIDALGRERGKSPVDLKWTTGYHLSEEDLLAHVAEGYNLGVRLHNRDVVIDVDPRNQSCPGGHAPVKDMFELGPLLVQGGMDPGIQQHWQCTVCGAVGMTPEQMAAAAGIDLSPYTLVRTGGGGIHAYATKPEDVLIRERNPDWPGIEFKTRGRQVVAAGSRHPSGNYYRWDDLSPPLAFTGILCEVVLSKLERPGVGDLSERPPGEINPAQAARLLAQLEPTDYADYGDWLNLGFAVFHATNGQAVEEWVEWSTGDEDYAGHEVAIRERWPSFQAVPGEPTRTLATLLREVRGAFGDVNFLDRDMLPDEPPPLPPGAVAAGPPLHPFDQFNLEFCHVPEGSKDFVYRKKRDGMWQRTNVESFKRLVAHRMMDNPDWDPDAAQNQQNKERIQIAPSWLRSEKRALFPEGVEFAPGGGREGYFNTYTGFAIEPADGDWSMHRELIEEVICGGDPEQIDYYLRYHAHMLQYPGQPAEVAIVLRSRHLGAGKNSSAQPFIDIFGRNRHAFMMSQGLGKSFNAHLEKVVYLVATEAFFAGSQEGKSQLKTMITERDLMFEPKGVDAYMANNCLHITVFSNDDWVVPAHIEERRFAIFDILVDRPREWWDRYHAQMAGGGTIGFMKHLLEMELGTWHPRAYVPQTEGLAEQKVQSLDPVSMAIIDLMRDEGHLQGEMVDDIGDLPQWEDGPIMVLSSVVAAAIKHDLGGRPGAQRMLAPGALGRALKRLLGDCVAHGRRAMMAGKRPYIWTFAPLSECRAAVESRIGGTVEWTE